MILSKSRLFLAQRRMMRPHYGIVLFIAFIMFIGNITGSGPGRNLAVAQDSAAYFLEIAQAADTNATASPALVKQDPWNMIRITPGAIGGVVGNCSPDISGCRYPFGQASSARLGLHEVVGVSFGGKSVKIQVASTNVGAVMASTHYQMACENMAKPLKLSEYRMLYLSGASIFLVLAASEIPFTPGVETSCLFEPV